MPPGQQQPSVSQGDLETFAEAYLKVSQLSNTYQSRIENANAAEQAKQLQREANQKMTQAVKNKGLSVQEYNETFNAIQQDPELEQEFQALIQEKR